ncbi:hypothetical protein Tco_1036713 [Tanacetum coccineum]
MCFRLPELWLAKDGSDNGMVVDEIEQDFTNPGDRRKFGLEDDQISLKLRNSNDETNAEPLQTSHILHLIKMNSYTFMGLDDVEEEEEISSHKMSFIKRAITYIKMRRQATRVTRNSITRDRACAHTRLVATFFSETPMYNETRFWKTFRMARPLFNQIVNAVSNHSAYFQSNPDCIGREGISPLIKCTSAIRQLAYGVNTSFLDEYMQISERSSRKALDHFCQAVMEIYGPEYLRKPTVTNIEKLYRHHEEKHGFPGMLGSLD